MFLKFDIREVQPIYAKRIVWLDGALLEGEIHMMDSALLPLEDGSTVRGFVVMLAAEGKMVEAASSASEHVEIALSRLNQDQMKRIQLGITTIAVNPPIAPNKPPVSQASVPEKKQSGWGAFWCLMSILARLGRRGN